MSNLDCIYFKAFPFKNEKTYNIFAASFLYCDSFIINWLNICVSHVFNMNRLSSKMSDWFIRILISLISIWDMIFLKESKRSKYNILNMKIYNEDRNLFVISEPSLHDWLTNKNKSCKDFIRDNYNDNYVNWSLKNLLSVILSIYINLSRFICSRSTGRLFFEVNSCRSDRFMSIVDFKSILCNQIDLSWQST